MKFAMRLFPCIALAGLLVSPVARVVAQLPPSKGAPQVGQKAPDSTLPDKNGNLVKLSELLAAPAGESRGKAAPRLLLIFYRGYW